MLLKLRQLLILIPLLAGCRKEVRQSEFPPLSNEGKNVVGLYADNYLFLPCQAKEFIFDPYHPLFITNFAQPGPNTFYFQLFTSNNCDRDYQNVRSINIVIDSLPISTGVSFKLSGLTNSNKVQARCTYKEKDEYYSADSTLPGKIKINYFDPAQRIISGEFDGTFSNYDRTKTIKITRGRFDMKF